MSDTIRESLLRSAADIGMKQREAQAKFESQQAQAKTAKGEASKAVLTLSRQAGGFTTPRFKGLAALGDAFANGGINDPDGDVATTLAADMVVSYVASFTAQTAKSKAGGTEQQMARLIRCGGNAHRVLAAMQQRIDYWTSIRDSADESDDAAEAKSLRESADRYLVCADSPKKDDKGVITKPAKWKGRPAVTVRGIDIPAGTGTNRTYQMAQVAAMFLAYGDDALHPDVIDALLDNGGKVEKAPASLAETAEKALDAIRVLKVDFGGESTGDSVNLSMMEALLGRIVQSGFASNVAAVGQRPVPASQSGTGSAAKAPPPPPPAPAPVAAPATPPPLPVATATPPADPVAESLAGTLTALPEADDEQSADDDEQSAEAIQKRQAERLAAEAAAKVEAPKPPTRQGRSARASAPVAKPEAPKPTRQGRRGNAGLMAS